MKHIWKIFILVYILPISCGIFNNKGTYIQLEKGTDNLNKLYRTLILDKVPPDLMLIEINDTLLQGQFYPDEKFDIYRINGKYFLPVGIWTGDDSCEILNKYISDDKYLLFLNTRHRYVVPISDLKMIDTLNCVHPKGISIVTYGGKQEGLHGSLEKDQIENKLNLRVGTDYLINGGGKINIKSEVDTKRNLVIISPYVVRPTGIRPQAFLSAGGSASFVPPSNNFKLIFYGDSYHVSLRSDSVYIRPDSICNNILISSDIKRR
jgi:hypothetical protein